MVFNPTMKNICKVALKNVNSDIKLITRRLRKAKTTETKEKYNHILYNLYIKLTILEREITMYNNKIDK